MLCFFSVQFQLFRFMSGELFCIYLIYLYDMAYTLLLKKFL